MEESGLFYPEGWPGQEVVWALSPEYWGMGYATDAAKVSVDWGFANTAASQLISLIIPENLSSIHMAKRLGQKYSHQVVIGRIQVDVYVLVNSPKGILLDNDK